MVILLWFRDTGCVPVPQDDSSTNRWRSNPGVRFYRLFMIIEQ